MAELQQKNGRKFGVVPRFTFSLNDIVIHTLYVALVNSKYMAYFWICIYKPISVIVKADK